MMVGLVRLLHLAEMETHSIATWRGKEDLKIWPTTKCQNLIIIQENLRHGNEEEELKVRIISRVSHHLKEPLVMESGLLILIHLGSLVLDHQTNGWSAKNLLGHNLVGFLQVKVFPKENKVISFLGSQRQITRVLVPAFICIYSASASVGGRLSLFIYSASATVHSPEFFFHPRE